jgi:poly(hydroxyalkanoate) depolymerase family esterase
VKRRLRLLAVLLAAPLVATAVIALARPAAAATLTQVTNFGTNPSNLKMFIYVPDRVAARPALLVFPHYCGGTASALFGGNGRDFVTAADRYGYIIIFPEVTRSTKCFDVYTAEALRRGGGSDPVGIMSMVSYTKQRYNVDPGRVYTAGYSSGAMMTNVLAAEYPDVFSAASAFSGVPATCFATTGGSTWNSQCSGGQIIKTAQQWGDAARAMYPGYTGPYPRMQLWHGTTDTTLAYPNFNEEIKQWTNLHGLSQMPAFTDRPQSNWTRTRYGNTGTQATVEGISIANTGHTLPQAGMVAYAISFLGLDAATTTTAPTTRPTTAPTTPPTTQPTTPPTSPATTAPATTTPVVTTPVTTAPATTTPTSNPPGGCQVRVIVNAWNSGLTEDITVTNTSSSGINGWSLVFTLPGGQSIVSGWNATYSPPSGQVTARNMSYNAVLAPNGSVSIGFQANHTGNSGKPTSISLNGTACTVS